jgi:membrane protein YqaA with SNARE-associated domain
MTDALMLLGLFASALLAATIVPASSEAVLAGLLATGHFSPWTLIGVAGIGNILGAAINWAIGRLGAQSRYVRTNDRIRPALNWFARWGRWSLLFSWLPVVGDPLTLAAGLSGVSLGGFLVPVAIGKIGRYVGIYWLTDSLF